MGRGTHITLVVTTESLIPFYRGARLPQPRGHLVLGGLTTTQSVFQVRARCRKEWGMFQTRMAEAEKAYYKMMGITPPNSTLA